MSVCSGDDDKDDARLVEIVTSKPQQQQLHHNTQSEKQSKVNDRIIKRNLSIAMVGHPLQPLQPP